MKSGHQWSKRLLMSAFFSCAASYASQNASYAQIPFFPFPYGKVQTYKSGPA